MSWIPNWAQTIDVQGIECYLDGFVCLEKTTTFSIGLRSKAYEQISFQLHVRRDTFELYILLPVLIMLALIGFYKIFLSWSVGLSSDD